MHKKRTYKKIPQTIKKEINQYIAELRKDLIDIEDIYLFGSYAKGTQNRSSDIDICIVSPSFSHPMKAMQYLWGKTPHHSKVAIEPVGFHPKDFKDSYSSLIQEIKKNGIRIE
ncbi:MAG: nucleotidyltransferase domain-containing protein [Candidatus Kerfeldbacteria bacterium]|nr:nucleotidyltransferase domain-containing protein [Candidatus Kerfeldbacteria bacterium]